MAASLSKASLFWSEVFDLTVRGHAYPNFGGAPQASSGSPSPQSLFSFGCFLQGFLGS